MPTGTTKFQFKVAGLNFKSTSYEWLVVAGARAQFKGTGTINDAGEYGFLLTAIDGQVNRGGGQDNFRIKIWDKASGNIIYDNMLRAGDELAPTTILGGGSIVIHKVTTCTEYINHDDPGNRGVVFLSKSLPCLKIWRTRFFITHPMFGLQDIEFLVPPWLHPAVSGN